MTNQIERLDNLLQHDVKCILHNRVVRRGRFLLYNIKKQNLQLTFSTNKGQIKTYEIPYPYDVVIDDQGATLDYRFDTLSLNSDKNKDLIKLFTKSESRFYDTTLRININ